MCSSQLLYPSCDRPKDWVTGESLLCSLCRCNTGLVPTNLMAWLCLLHDTHLPQRVWHQESWCPLWQHSNRNVGEPACVVPVTWDSYGAGAAMGSQGTWNTHSQLKTSAADQGVRLNRVQHPSGWGFGQKIYDTLAGLIQAQCAMGRFAKQGNNNVLDQRSPSGIETESDRDLILTISWPCVWARCMTKMPSSHSRCYNQIRIVEFWAGNVQCVWKPQNQQAPRPTVRYDQQSVGWWGHPTWWPDSFAPCHQLSISKAQFINSAFARIAGRNGENTVSGNLQASTVGWVGTTKHQISSSMSRCNTPWCSLSFHFREQQSSFTKEFCLHNLSQKAVCKICFTDCTPR